MLHCKQDRLPVLISPWKQKTSSEAFFASLSACEAGMTRNLH